MKASTAGMCGGPQFCSNPSGTGAAVDILPLQNMTFISLQQTMPSQLCQLCCSLDPAVTHGLSLTQIDPDGV
jgi:hypothetical protein